ncbi:MAG: hypothetical protein PHE43_04155 [Candidatus Nanoarchaeia archaeon]|nr:hypothetical protein [Candidatus Nanoarchaeia archaeon]
MKADLVGKVDREFPRVNLPEKNYLAWTHPDNILYCINILEKCSKFYNKDELVLGYMKGIVNGGNNFGPYVILPKHRADIKKEQTRSFGYITINQLKDQCKKDKNCELKLAYSN